MSTAILFLIVIVFLVVAHELGHFFVAKLFGVRVDEFGVGYPPRARKLFTWRGTLFTLNWLPFGGFVKIFGEDVVGEDKKGSFAYQKMWKRVLIIVAGIAANTLLAMVLYAVSFGVGFLGSPSDFPGSVPLGPHEILVTNVIAGSPASDAGLKSGDVIERLSVAENQNESLQPTSADQIASFVHAHRGKEITISLLRNKVERTVGVTPRISKTQTEPSIGISLAEASPIRLPFFRAIGAGVTYTIHEFGAIIVSLGALVAGAFHGNNSLLSQISGPVGIAQIAGQAYTLGIGSLLGFVALISVNLAVINLLPLPALDGGRIILELFAKDGRSRIPQRVVSSVNQIGFLLLILLMLYVTYRDIVRLVT